MHVLCPEEQLESVGLDQRLQRAQRGERWAHHDVTRLVVLLLEAVRELLHDLDRDEVVVVHLPVARDDWSASRHALLLGWDRRAANPGKSPCSTNSNAAPPPVL